MKRFQSIDTNGDGVLQREELIEGLSLMRNKLFVKRINNFVLKKRLLNLLTK